MSSNLSAMCSTAWVILAVLTHSGNAEPFTLVVLPDTQEYVKSDALNLGFEAQTSWIAEHAAERNIKFVTQVGDIVSEGGGGLVGDKNQPQWDRASRAMSVLDQATARYPHGIPWATAVGNHELDRVDVVNSGFTQWASYFGANTTGRYDGKPWFGGSSPNELNTYQRFEANNREYLMLHLEFDVPDDAITWAQGVLETYPNRPTILTTHVYEGTVFGPPSNPYLLGAGRNSQLQIFDKLIANNPQIFMVLSGHTGEERQRIRYNNAGLPVFQLVQDYASRPHGGEGWMRLLEFDEQAEEIRVRTFTPGVPANPHPRYETDCNSEFAYPLDWAVRFDGASPPASQATSSQNPIDNIIDDYQLDTSSNYALSQSYGAGGRFKIQDGVLALTPGYNNTVAVMLDDGEHFLRPGEWTSVDVLDDGNSFLQVSTVSAQPNAQNSFGFRLRRDLLGFRINRYSERESTLTDYVCDPGGPLTLRIDRLTATKFEFSYEVRGQRHLIGQSTLPEGVDHDQLYVGVQAYSSLPTIRFDNLRILSVPEPASGLLLFIGMSLMAAQRRRKRECAH